MAIVENPQTIELEDIQGILTRGYGQLPYSSYILLEVKDPVKVRRWLHKIIPQISPASRYEKNLSVNIAFTYAGLEAMGLSDKNLKNFSLPFREGMASPIRRYMLGDFGKSAPENWVWGGVLDEDMPKDHEDSYLPPPSIRKRRPHVLLLIYASGTDHLDMFRSQIEYTIPQLQDDGTPGETGLVRLHQIDGYRRDDAKEHFGFRDSISQPVIKGSGRKGPAGEIAATGEFVLGYLNEYKLYPFSPLITDPQGDLNLLPADANESGS